jgi:hypothetical protein
MQMSDSPTRPSVSIAIVNWNTRELLRACLASLPFDSPALALDVIVVDNGSTDGSPEMVAAEFPAVRLIRNTENAGFVRATNQGLLAGTGDFLFMLNSDTEVRPGCLERLVEVAASDPAIGAVGPRLLNPDGTPQVSVAPFPLVIHRLLPSRFEHAYNVRVEQHLLASTSGVSRVDWMSGAALLFRRDVLERVGPLDERYFMWYDDVDWAQKLRKAGYDRVFVPDAVIVHHGRSSARKLDDRSLAQQMFDSEYTYLRLHAGLAATWLVYSLRVAKALLRWLVPLAGSRSDAAFRLAYHAQRFRRFCLSPMPPRGPAVLSPEG